MREASKFTVLVFLAVMVAGFVPPSGRASGQEPAVAATPHRTRLYLKGGDYQVVMSYRIVGDVVHYVSAERGGAEEEIPVRLVDFEATKKWERQHSGGAAVGSSLDPGNGQEPASTIDPELLKEEASRAALTPEVAPSLRLPQEDSVLVLDTFHALPELVPMGQTDSELNRYTAHSVEQKAVNPKASPHSMVEIKGEEAPVQLHVADPVFFIRLGDDLNTVTGGGAITVDTHGASGNAPSTSSGGAPESRYVVLRADVRTGLRVLASFQPWQLNGGVRQEDVVQTKAEVLPGGHWMKLTPVEGLSFGEYALMEVLSDTAVNAQVWDFGVHPVAKENADAIKPVEQRPLTLERRSAPR